MNREFVKFQYLLKRIFVYQENIEIKTLLKTESIKKSQVKSTSISMLGTRLKIYIDSDKSIDVDLMNKNQIKDLSDHINGYISFEDLIKKYNSGNSSSEKSSIFSRKSANIIGAILLFGGFVTLFSGFITGLLIFLSGLIIFPKTFKLISNKTKNVISKKSRILIALALLIVVSIVSTSNPTSNIKPEKTQEVEPKQEVVESQNNNGIEIQNTPTENTVVGKQLKQPEPAPAPKVENVYQPTLGERNALSSAKQYLSYSAFSKGGLIEQLEYEDYSPKEIDYAMSQISVDWNHQAALTAETYLEYSAFSRSGLIEQLEYEGFTRSQAEYGANAVGY
jgi:hypothetical protein